MSRKMIPNHRKSTLFYTPLQLGKYIREKNFIQSFVELGKYVTNSIKCMIASRCHPLSFLGEKQSLNQNKTNYQLPEFQKKQVCIFKM